MTCCLSKEYPRNYCHVSKLYHNSNCFYLRCQLILKTEYSINYFSIWPFELPKYICRRTTKNYLGNTFVWYQCVSKAEKMSYCYTLYVLLMVTVVKMPYVNFIAHLLMTCLVWYILYLYVYNLNWTLNCQQLISTFSVPGVYTQTL